MTNPTAAQDHGPGSLILLRHGETEWARAGRHTGLTDVPLTVRGEEFAAQTPALLQGRVLSLVLTSPLQRARHTAQLAGLDQAEVDADLVEWDYGGYEGKTTIEVREMLGYPWTVFADGVIPGTTPGESIEEVAERGRRVIARVLPYLATGDVALVGHGHSLRILAAVFLGQEPRFGAQLKLGTGAVSVLGWERQMPAIEGWNRTLQ